MKFLSLNILFLLWAGYAQAAPCCAGASAMPTLITADDRAQLSLAVAHESIRATVDDAGLETPRSARNVEELQTVTLRGSYVFGELLQSGIELPIVRRFRHVGSVEDSSTGVGDVSASLAYEFLPETSYSWWRPRAYAFTKLTLPTGESTSDPTASATSATGKGFYAWSLGVALVKTFRHFDVLLAGEGHLTFGKTFSANTPVSIRYGNSLGMSGLANVGWSPAGGAWRLGLSLNPTTDGVRSYDGVISGETLPRYVWNASATLGYRISTDWSSSLAYVDQTLLPSRNVDISRSISLLLQRHFEL